MTVKFAERETACESSCMVLVADLETAAGQPRLQVLDRSFAGAITGSMEAVQGATDKGYPIVVFGPAARVVVVVPADAGSDPLDLGARLAGTLARSGIWSIALDADPVGFEVPDMGDWIGKLIGGMMLALHRHGGQKASVGPAHDAELQVVGSAPADRATIARQLSLADSICHARALVLDPPNLLTPIGFAERCAALAMPGMVVEIFDKDALQQMGMGGLLCIAQGSPEPPRMVVMRWQPQGRVEKPLVLIGKGVTFDSGGLALKQKSDMHDMKHDMAGAAAVVGAMRSIAQLELDRHVVGVIGLVENMPDGAAVKPGDVVRMMSGLTVEIENPDAEGRIVLADLLHYAVTQLAPSAMVDIATLTGAVQTALGPEIAAMFANDEALAVQLAAASARSGDLLWRLPLHQPYDKHIEGVVSDLRNMGRPKVAGAIYGALFLQRFCQGVPWAHLDAGGVAWLREKTPLHPQGTTGYGIRLLEELATSRF